MGISLILYSLVLITNHHFRPNASEALEHPYFRQYHDPSDEPVSERIVDEVDGDLSIEQWRSLVWQEMVEFQSSRGRDRLQLATAFFNGTLPAVTSTATS